MSVTLYSSGCPKCRVLKQKLEKKSIPYEYVEDTQEMIDKGFKSAPQLEIDDEYYDFNAARKLIDIYDAQDSSFEQFVTSQKAE